MAIKKKPTERQVFKKVMRAARHYGGSLYGVECMGIAVMAHDTRDMYQEWLGKARAAGIVAEEEA